jgi:probable rRNA maturation factor
MVKLDYIVKNKKWLKFLKEKNIKKYITNIFKNVTSVLGYKISFDKTVELSVTFTDDVDIQYINKNFRNQDVATNVLSFPIYEKEFLSALEKERYLLLGDIILSIDTIEKESLEQNKTFMEHLSHLMVHSILHLFGFDHTNDENAEEMERIEVIILGNMGIKNPY